MPKKSLAPLNIDQLSRSINGLCALPTVPQYNLCCVKQSNLTDGSRILAYKSYIMRTSTAGENSAYAPHTSTKTK